MTVGSSGAPLTVRVATRDDLPAVVAMLADDILGAEREDASDPLPDGYLDAFRAIERDPNIDVIVAEQAGDIVGSLHLMVLPHLTFQGGWRAQIEAVRVSSSARGRGLGRRLVEWAVAEADRRGCHLVQLTTDIERGDVRRFYEELGFEASHAGMKRYLARSTG